MSGSPSQNPLRRLLGEIHRRSLWQVLAIYVAASWIVFEVVQTLTEGLGLPGWFPAFAFVLLLIGLPIVLATAFLQEGVPGHRSADTVSELEEIFSDTSSSLEDEREAVAEPGGARRIFTWRNALLAGMAAFALWGVVTAGWVLLGGGTEGEESGALLGAAENQPTVAVLPFTNMSPDEENAYFADGVHEDILAHLSKIRDLTVLARTSMIRYRDSDKSVEEIAAELDADAVLEGSVRRAGDQIRIVTQLIDPGTGGHLWAETYDRRLEVDNVFAVQTDVARQIARALDATLSPEEAERIGTRPTESLAAYDLYLQGREAYQRFEDDANDQAIRLYRRALEHDPGYALAWAGLGDAFAQRTFRYGYQRAWADTAVRYARRATEFDAELAEGYKALALALSVGGHRRDALDEYLRTIELDPNHFPAVNNIGLLYRGMGRLDEAVRWLRRSVRLAPNHSFPPGNLASTYMRLLMDDSATKWVERALTLEPEFWIARTLMAALDVYRGRGVEAVIRADETVRALPGEPLAWTSAAGVAYMARDFERAVGWARESLRIAPDNTLRYWHFTETLLALSLVRSGARDQGNQMLREAIEAHVQRIEEGDEAYWPPWDLAAAHAALGDDEAALDWLERAYEAGFRLVRWLRFDPAFDDLRDDPRFRELVDRMETDVERMRARVIRDERAAGLR